MSIQKVVNAIREIDYERNFKIDGTDIDDCTIEWINGSSEISKADIKTKMQEIADAATKKINDKASANAKLKALGLTDDEIEALK